MNEDRLQARTARPLRRCAEATLLFFSACVTACDGGAAPVDAGTDLDSPVGRGFAAVQVRDCGGCHAPLEGGEGNLSGRAIAVPGTLAYPSNLTPDPDTGMDAWDAGSIAAAVLFGVDQSGGALCGAMPRYREAGMTTDEAFAIAAYLNRLAPVWHPVPASSCTTPSAEAGPDGGL